MKSEIIKLHSAIDESDKILITSHLGPDADSLTSSTVLASTLRLNFPDKTVAVVMEEQAEKLDFIDGYKDIEFTRLAGSLTSHQPDLIILMDAGDLGRCTRDLDTLKQNLGRAKLVIIDHHEPDDKAEPDIYINQKSPAVAQDIYEILFDELKLKKPDGYAQSLMLGIYTDTGGFLYKNIHHKKTFKIASQLIEDGANLEALENKLNQYTEAEMLVFAELAKNIKHKDGYTYSFLSDDFTEQWLADKKTANDYKGGCEVFVNNFLRNIEGRQWGFIVYRDLLSDRPSYKVSFRSVSGFVDVSKIAKALGGGGHIPAAGATIEAASAEDAIERVHRAISSVK